MTQYRVFLEYLLKSTGKIVVVFPDMEEMEHYFEIRINKENLIITNQ